MLNKVQTNLMLMALCLTCFIAKQSFARDIDQSKSIGYTQTIGGPNGLSIGVGVGDVHFEGVFGATHFTGNSVNKATFLSAGLGLHYHLLRAQQASFSIGGRLNIGSGSLSESLTNDQGLQTDIQVKDIVQWGVDIPFRVYWFPAESVSIHSEFGIALLIGPENGTIFGESTRNGYALQSNEMQLKIFEGDAAFGRLGLTFWW